jgi:hypothetical protein
VAFITPTIPVLRKTAGGISINNGPRAGCPSPWIAAEVTAGDDFLNQDQWQFVVSSSGDINTGTLTLKPLWEQADPFLLDCFNARRQVSIKVQFENYDFETLVVQLEP